MVKPLHMVYLLGMASYLTMWKKATVTAIHKKGNMNFPNNYISSIIDLYMFSAMLETIVKDRVMNLLLSPCQHAYGFHSSHALLCYLTTASCE